MSSNMFTFGSGTNKPFSFGSTPAFGAPATSATTTTGFNFGLAPSATTLSTAPATSTTTSVLPAASSAFSFGAAAPAPASAAPKFSFPMTTSVADTKAEPTKPTLTAGQPYAATINLSTSSPALTFGIPAVAASTAPVAPTTGVAAAPAISTAVSAVSKPVACLAPVSQSVVPVPAASSGSVLPVSSSTAVPASQQQQKPLTYDQLEEMINGWTLEVEEQEQLFTQHASRINNLDRCLMANADKIVDMGESVERLEHEQARIEHELDFSTQQQAELGQLLDQLEKALDDGGMRRDSLVASQMPSFRGDLQREQMVQQQVALDNQIAQVSRQLETATLKVQSSAAFKEIGGPLQQIAQVLAKQMDALQWISDRTAELKQQMSGVKRNLGTSHDFTR